MAASRSKHDIFLSYARSDNLPPTTSPTGDNIGWVTALHEHILGSLPWAEALPSATITPVLRHPSPTILAKVRNFAEIGHGCKMAKEVNQL
jgi:hypothetical protein